MTPLEQTSEQQRYQDSNESLERAEREQDAAVREMTFPQMVSHIMNDDDPCIVLGCDLRYGHLGAHNV